MQHAFTRLPIYLSTYLSTRKWLAEFPSALFPVWLNKQLLLLESILAAAARSPGLINQSVISQQDSMLDKKV